MKNSRIRLTDSIEAETTTQCMASFIYSSISLCDPTSPYGLLDAASLQLEAPIYDVEYSQFNTFINGNITFHFNTKAITRSFGDTNVYERIGLMQLGERGIRGSGNIPQSQFFDAETLDRQRQRFVLL
ncbi:hypothetical protein E8E14_009227 [Neopestalotiopsis sp. 37M]|nr:hypothetical protein E8E14_009227 [Neopestalotiopsis sp. 37M]